MFATNPFSILAETVPSVVMQGFVVLMILLIVAGTLLDIIHKKNVKYFFENAKKAKKNATKELTTGERIAVVSKTIAYDIGTTSELGAGKRRVAHLLGMYGTILFWIGSVVMIFCYSSANAETPTIWPMIWHVGALMTILGGSWFWFFLRVDVYSEAQPWYRIIKADLCISSDCNFLNWIYLVISSKFKFRGKMGCKFIFSIIYSFKFSFIWWSLLVKICSHVL